MKRKNGGVLENWGLKMAEQRISNLKFELKTGCDFYSGLTRFRVRVTGLYYY